MLSKLKLFFRSFYQSSTDPTYYRHIINAKTSFSIKYLLMLSLVLSIGSTIILSVVGIPQFQTLRTQIKTKVEGIYPDNLVISLKNGKLQTNQEQPLTIEVPGLDKEPYHSVVIDTTAKVEDMDRYNALMLVTSDTVSIRNDNREIRTYNLNEMSDFDIDKPSFDKFVRSVSDISDTLVYLLPLVFFIGSWFIISVSLIIRVLIFSLITALVAMVYHYRLSYSKYFQITAHAITPITIIQVVQIVFNLNVPIPFFYGILFVVFVAILISILKKTPAKLPGRK